MKPFYIIVASMLLVLNVCAQSLSFKNNNFKIVQFTDIHYIADNEGAQASISLIKEVLDSEKPQLVVFTGDIVVGEPIIKGWDNVLTAVIERKIPFAVTFGNHDDEKDVSRKEIMLYIAKKPLCVARHGPENIKGVGNYVAEVVDNTGVRLVLYFMDSNSYSTIEGLDGYGWFGTDQINWYKNISSDYSKKSGAVIPALAFFHIPLNEYTELAETRKYVGMRNEKECPGAINTGMFAAMAECKDVMGTFVGHDHDNDYIGLHKGIYLAYGRFSGTSTTYTHMTHGARVIETTVGERGFKTWIRLPGNKIINKTDCIQQ